MRRLQRRWSVVAVGIVVSVGFAVHPVMAGPARPASEAVRPLKAGDLPDEARAQAVMEFVHGFGRQFGDEVYASTDWETGEVLVAASEQVLPSVMKYDNTVVEGLRVKVFAAKVTPAALDEAIVKLGATKFDNANSVDSYGLPIDASAIDVNVIDLDKLPVETRDQLAETIQTITNSPVHLKPARVASPATRYNFDDPWEGGGGMQHGSHGCSVGFAVLDGVYGRLLSAAHCDESAGGNPHWSWDNWAGNHTITNGGSAVSLNNGPLDSMLIDPIGGTEGTVFGGAYNQQSGTARYKLNVNGAGAVSIGDYVCTSGANSGEHYSSGCLIKVDSGSHVACSFTQSGVCHRWWGYNVVQNGVAAAELDSGGPVYENLGNDRVGARGIIQGIDTNVLVTCVNVRYGSPNRCSNYVRFAGINDVLEAWGVSIETN